ncbi:FtsQ-type POTRA domain-containing protein [Francisellaceae bacterium]|nr:FtsQ-type POTRA domain-containing protein [Francisellaceae bacterium]
MSIRAYIKIGILCLVIISAWGAWAFVHKPGQFPISNIKVTGNYQYIPPKKLQQLILPYINQGFFNTDVSALQERLSKLPGINSVTVKKSWPDSVAIKLTQQSAFAIWNNNQIVTPSGDVFKPQEKIDKSILPEFVGLKHNAKKMIKEYKSFQAELGELYRIKKIEYLGNQWQLVLSNDISIRLGNHHVEERLTRFVNNYPELAAKHPNETLVYFDARYPKAFALKWKKNA